MNVMRVSLWCAVISVFLLGAAHASLRDPDVRTARECTQYFAKHERINGIPSHLLAAISATESGRYNKQLKMVLPWPWTINAEGKGYYFNSKAEAIRKVREYQAQGVKSIDIGCMQVNLRHHPDAFASLNQAFDPKYNVAYAAKFLKRNFEDAGSWNKAIQYYHSRTPKYGMKYLQSIQKNWGKISGKIRTAMRETEPKQKPRKSFRVVEVKDSDGSNSTGEVKISSLAPRNNSFSMQAKPETKMMRLRDIDRLSGFKNRTLKDIRANKSSKPAPMVMNVNGERGSLNNDDGPVKVTAVRPVSSSKPAAETQAAAKNSTDALTSAENTVKSRRIEPKFIFVQ